jgi:hypothetical protein
MPSRAKKNIRVSGLMPMTPQFCQFIQLRVRTHRVVVEKGQALHFGSLGGFDGILNR